VDIERDIVNNLVLDTPGSVIIGKISRIRTFELYMSRDFGDEL
jgi:hypothetical protein